MLKKYLNQNSHSNAKYLNELVQSSSHLTKKQSQKINFDSFIYIDKLTNNKIVIGDVKSMYNQKQKRNIQSAVPSVTRTIKKPPSAFFKNKEYSQTKQMQEINECFSLMKSTKLFEMENLKNKIFSKNQETNNKENEQIQSMIKKKKKIREYIENYLNSICLHEFRKYMQPPNQKQNVKLINPNVLALHKNMSNKINKHNIQKIIEEFLQSESGNKQKKHTINISIDDIDFPEEERLKQLLFHRMSMKNKQFQYLIAPGHAKQIYSQIHNNTSSKNRLIYQPKYDINIDQFAFNQFEQGTKLKSNSRRFNYNGKSMKKISKQDQKLERKQKQLICAIEAGSVYDFLFLIIRWPTLLHSRDTLGNTILHIAAKYDQAEVYNLLIKKIGPDCLREKNNGGKTPPEIAQLFGSFEVQKCNQSYKEYI